MVELVVVLWPPGICYSSLILSEELLVVAAGQDTQDLDRVVRVVLMGRLCRHGSILPQHADIGTGRRPACQPARRPRTKASHSAAGISSLGSSGFLESRIATMPGRLVSTSTQFWPVDEL